MSFIKSRLRRLESDQRGCPECYQLRYHKARVVHFYYPGEGEEPPEEEACPRCGRSLGVVLKVEYEGEGVSVD
jgi:hypothetical protein